ncbi:MAG: hypothetical protein QOG20_4579 [Pseudonocardiales bacterium]|nr:hypothetical protein [Pseudonocardiales bacterium]
MPSDARTVLATGDAAVLVEVAGLSEVLALAAALREAALPGVLDVVPAARTVLLITAPGTDLTALRRMVLALPVEAGAGPPAGSTVEIPVTYDGPDLEEVGRITGLGAEGVVEAHTATPWRVGFGGFAPGFAYLAGGDERLHVARRDEPRTAVPPGSVGLAGEFSGVYPRASPGGWQLIGRTDAVLWDETREPPALLQPGAEVRFVRADHTAEQAVQPSRAAAAPRAGGLEVLAVGASALVQDLGRPGLAASGVGRSGAADRAALRLANRLVANPEDAAGVEVVFGGLSVRARQPLTVALAGAHAPADLDGRPMGHHAVLPLRRGQVLTLGVPPTGLRTYLAVRGGIAVEPVLGSRATDVLSGVGPAPLGPGDVLAVGPEPSAFPLIDVAPVAVPPSGTVTLRAVLGPRAGWTGDPGALARTTWTASSRSDRVGMRLEGEPLRRLDRRELPSEGMVRGAVQVPPGGEPVLFLADHPVTGGYPVVAVVLDADVDRAAQVRPGQQVRFTLVPPPWKEHT